MNIRHKLLGACTICNELVIGYAKDEEKQLKQPTQEEEPPLTVVLLGDLKYGRTVHSLAALLAETATAPVWNSRPIELRYCSPMGLEMPPPLQKYIQSFGPTKITQHSYENLVDACEGANVLYATRVQQERFDDAEKKNNKCDETLRQYRIDLDLLQDPRVPLDMVLLHPLPRIDEIDTQVDSDPRAAYFRQVENGMLIRMALLSLLLGKA